MNQEGNQEDQSQIGGKIVMNDGNGNIAGHGPNSTTTSNDMNVSNIDDSNQYSDKSHVGALSAGAQAAGVNAKDKSPSEAHYSKLAPASPAAKSPTRSVHQESVDNTTVDSLTEPQVLAKEVASSQSSAGQKNEQEGESNAVEATEESSSAKEDMEVEEINNTGSSSNNQDAQDSDNSANEKNTKSKSIIMERRSSKRSKRRNSASNRYSPGEGGGLASKKPKLVVNESGATASNTIKSPALKAPPDDANIAVDEKASRQEKGGKDGFMQRSIEWSEPKYRWIDEGVLKRDGTSSLAEHKGAEIDFANSKTKNWTPPPPFVVRPGDVVLLSSGDAPWDDAKHQNAQVSNQHQAKREVVPIYNDPASREAGLGVLDPYIGLVEKLWEEVEDTAKKAPPGQRKKKGKNAKSTKPSKMMIRTRWFFKKEDLEGIKGSFAIEGGGTGGSAKDEILAAMSSQDLVLTDQSDDNIISAVLGKVKVVKRKPLDKSQDVEMTDAKGTNVCRYNLSFCPAESTGKEATVKLSPCTDGGAFKVTRRNESKEIDSTEPTSTDDDGYTSTRDEKQGGDNYAAPFSPASFTMSPRRLVSEGATTVGKIKVGLNHQAVIPQQINLQRKTSFRGLANPPSQRMPMMVWDPASDEGDTVDEFLEEACSVLSNHMKVSELELFLDANYVEAPNAKAELKKPREVNIDCLLTELHECKGDVRRAINKISSHPEKYMSIWHAKEKEQFDNSYRVYRESIRMIANSLGDSKSCKDAIDYQYRYKFVENFRRFMRKKHEKAEELMATAEDRMLNEKMKEDAKSQEAIETDVSSSEEEEGKVSAVTDGKMGSKLTAVPATHTGPVNNRIRQWFRTGATQQRRNLAADVLSQIAEKVDKDAYVTLTKSIKACNSNQATDSILSDVKETAKDILTRHPDLFAQFLTFLPKEVRNN